MISDWLFIIYIRKDMYIMKYKFLEEKDNRIYFIGNLMEIYIPKSFFDNKMAMYIGDKIESIALFNFIVYDDENDRMDKSGSLYSFELPMNITFQYQEHFTKNDIKGKFPDRYEVFVLRTGDMFVDNKSKEKSSSNTKNFVFNLNSGKIPSTLSYDEVLYTFLKSMELNNVDLGNPSVIYEAIISELYRYKNDEKIPFRIALNNNNNLTLYDYQAINVKNLPAIKGTFQALMFEDIKQSILNSILKSKQGEEESETPVEKVIKY